MSDRGHRTAPATNIVQRASALADRLDGGRVVGVLGPGAWSVLKVIAIGAATPVLWPAVGLLAARNNAIVRRRHPAHAASLAAAANGAVHAPSFAAIGHLRGDRPVVVTSDLHRVPAGPHDWPRRQGTGAIYEVMLDHYAAEAWHLVENGDVEDFWMVGGSAWGWCYDVLRLCSTVLPRRLRTGLRRALVTEHLDRTVANNSGIYDRINSGFHLHGRYHRVIGNHDDAYADPLVVDHLGLHHPGLEVHDALVVRAPSSPPVVITHGHHTDAWNAPDLAFLGRLGTWLAATIGDVPLLAVEPGLPTADATTGLLGGRQRNALTVVGRVFGASRDLYSMDEELLFAAVRRQFPEGTTNEPFVVLGHTHLPLSAPTTGDREHTWSRYLNAGSGVGVGVVTAVEWQPPTGPDVAAGARLVAWCRAGLVDPEAEVEQLGVDRLGHPIVRVVLSPSPDGTLVPAGAGTWAASP